MYLNKSHKNFDYIKEMLCLLRPGGIKNAISYDDLRDDLDIDGKKLTAIIKRSTEKLGFVVHIGFAYSERVVYVPEAAWDVVERHANRYWESVYGGLEVPE